MRMKLKFYKVFYLVCGKFMVEYVVDEVLKLFLLKFVMIVGYGVEEVKKQFGDKSEYVF